jgi:GNAT superfamily N-acetyltransferase
MIRKARYSDILRLVEMTHKLYLESPYEKNLGVTYDEDSAMFFLKWQIENEDDRVIFVYEKDGVIRGFLVGQKGRWMFNKDEFIGVSLYWYVEPKFRKGWASVRLMKEFEKWCISRGCVGIDTGSTTELQGERVSKLFKRMGFPELGMQHSKSLRRVA